MAMGGDGVRIKYFQKLDIASNDSNQIAFIPAFQFCRSKLAKGFKNFVTDNSKKLKRDIVAAGLFNIMKHAAQKPQDKDDHKKQL